MSAIGHIELRQRLAIVSPSDDDTEQRLSAANAIIAEQNVGIADAHRALKVAEEQLVSALTTVRAAVDKIEGRS